jgi:hypothetical protein
MHAKLWAMVVVILLWQEGFQGRSHAQSIDEYKSTLVGKRELLAKLRSGMSCDEVLKILGKPDEVRTTPVPRFENESAEWAYGPLAPGKFASIGIVYFDALGKVSAASAPDCFCTGNWGKPDQVLAISERSMETLAKMSCHAEMTPVTLKERQEYQNLFRNDSVKFDLQLEDEFHLKVTIKNAGTERFELKDVVGPALTSFLLIELYDSNGVMVHRIDRRMYYSPMHRDPADCPVLAILPNHEKSECLWISPEEHFGALPPGKYSARVFFPFEKQEDSGCQKYFPSNLVKFAVKETEKKK